MFGHEAKRRGGGGGETTTTKYVVSFPANISDTLGANRNYFNILMIFLIFMTGSIHIIMLVSN